MYLHAKATVKHMCHGHFSVTFEQVINNYIMQLAIAMQERIHSI